MSTPSAEPAAAPTDPQPADPAPRPAQIGVLSLLAVAVGLLAGGGATAFVAVEHHLQGLLWESLPEALGAESAPWWLVIALLLTGALITYGALQLPGHGGHSPLHGFGTDIGPGQVISVVLAALGSLSFGAALGPEAPLMAVGTALGALAFRDPTSPVRQVMMLVGAMAAVGAIFGNPLVTCVLMLEFAMLAGPRVATTAVMLPALVGMASSYVLQVGFADWSGLGEVQLGLPGLAPYPQVQGVDLAVAVPLAVVIGIVVMGSRLLALRVAVLAAGAPLPTLLGAGAVVALSAVAVRSITGGELELVLFSGQSAMVDYLGLASVGTALVVLVGKFVAYAVSLGGGFRGGAIFPAIALGTILVAPATLLVGGTSASALAATAIGAATAAAMRLPFTALLLAVMLTYPAGGATTVLAIIGTVIGLLTRLSGERFAPALQPK